MGKRFFNCLFGVFFALIAYAGCQVPNGGENPLIVAPAWQKPDFLKKRLVTSPQNKPAYVQSVAYVDVAKENPLNAGDYFIEENGNPIPLFDHVVLGTAFMIWNANGYPDIELSPALRNVLENQQTYIRPLQKKGIRVLVEIRSGAYSNISDKGVSLGMGTMDMTAINLFVSRLKMLVDHYKIDGFEFNDIGGGTSSFPPETRTLKQFQSNQPLYPDKMFQDANGNWLDNDATEKILWREGAGNFSSLLFTAYEGLKESIPMPLPGNPNYVYIVERSILVRNNEHGGTLPNKVRCDVNLGIGQNPYTVNKLLAIVNDDAHDTSAPTLNVVWEEQGDTEQPPNEKGNGAYAPFTIKLSLPLDDDGTKRPDNAEAKNLAGWFAAGDTSLAKNPYYGTLYFYGLPTLSEDPGIVAYLSNYTQEIFGQQVKLQQGGGDYPKP